jgi:hypothetical protein
VGLCLDSGDSLIDCCLGIGFGLLGWLGRNQSELCQSGSVQVVMERSVSL